VEKPKRNKSKVAYVILSFMAFSFMAAGGVLTYFSYDFSENAIPTSGIVLEVDASYNDGSTTYSPTFAYVDFNGNKHAGQPFLSSSSYNFPLGSRVAILYDRRDPRSLRVDSWFAVWGFSLVFLAAGLVMTIIAAVLRRVSGGQKAAASAKPGRKIRSRSTGADKFESEEDHQRETKYTPTVRRQ